nr:MULTISPECIES: VOC family protein [unclassified Roseitalea]
MADFMCTVFGAHEVRRIDHDDGTVRHVEVKIDDSVIMVGQAGGGFEPVSAWLHVYVADADGVYARAIAQGASPMFEPELRPGDTDRRGGFIDPWGNTWFPATQVVQ